jgi:rod shape determining protein RodA
MIRIKRIDWPFALSFIALAGLGLGLIYGSAFPVTELSFFYRQLFFFFLGLFLMLGLALFFDYRWLKNNSLLVLGGYLTFLLLLAGLFLVYPIRGIYGWYSLGSITFDPAPFAQLGLIVVLAKYFSSRYPRRRQFPVLLLSLLYALLPAGLVFLQPDFGSAIIFFIIWLGLIFVSGLPWRQIVLLLLSFSLIGGLIWSFGLLDYQKERVINFFYPTSAGEGGNWQLQQSKIAIGSGGWLGRGWNQNSQARYGFLPEARTDFSFSVLAEAFGFLGVIVFLLLFSFLVWRLVYFGLWAEDNFAYLLILGYLIWLTSQAFLSVGMNLGWLPVIGIPCPLISYGGSGLLAFFLGGGLVLSTRRPFA